MNRHELVDNFMMTRLANHPETSNELMENVSNGIFSNIPQKLFAFVCCFSWQKEKFGTKKNIITGNCLFNFQNNVQIVYFVSKNSNK